MMQSNLYGKLNGGHSLRGDGAEDQSLAGVLDTTDLAVGALAAGELCVGERSTAGPHAGEHAGNFQPMSACPASERPDGACIASKLHVGIYIAGQQQEVGDTARAVTPAWP